jgi:peptide deformylase
MVLRSIIIAPDPRLKIISAPVASVTAEIRALMDDMLETMYAAPGIGLAAVQIGVPKRVIVIDLAKEGQDDKPHFFVNPELIWASEETEFFEEGCLSLPEMYELLERPARCRVRFLDYRGATQEIEFSGMMATCLQHEMDHLQGVLFVDRISRLKREIVLKKLIKAKKLAERDAV